MPAPTVQSLTGIPANGMATTTDMISEFDVVYSQLMDPAAVTSVSSYDLRDSGNDGTFDTADDQVFTLDVSSDYFYGTNGIHIDVLEGPLGIGEYRWSIISGGAANPFGTPLDGDGDTVGGDNYEALFTVSIEPFVATGALAGLGSVSANNPGSLGSASDADDYGFFVEAGESVTAVIRPGDPSVKLDAEFVGLSGVVSAAAAGDVVIIPLTEVPTTGNVTLSVSGDAATSYNFDVYRNLNVAGLIEDSAAVDIEDSFFQLGSGRYAAIAESSGNLAGTQFVQTNDTGAFIDISGTGTALGLTDDSEATITSTVGNAVFPAGQVTVANNGGIIAAGGEDLPYTNTALPSSNWGTALLPLWDDIDADTGDVYWEEMQVGGINTLIVQWNDRPRYNNIGDATFQIQLYESGPILARFAYADVDFGDSRYDFGASATVGYQASTSSAFTFSVNTPSLANGDVVDLVTLDPNTDGDEFAVDLEADLNIDIVVNGISSSFAAELVELIDPSGDVVATGSTMPLGTPAPGIDQAILDYNVQDAGTYKVRVSANQMATYSLLVTEDLVYDVESNNDITPETRALDDVNGALGFLSTSEDDIYRIDMDADEVFLFETRHAAGRPQ